MTTTKQELTCVGQVKMNSILTEILKGGCVISGSKGSGKTNSAKIIISEILKQQKLNKQNNIEIKVMDTCLSWLFDFNHLEYQLIGDNSTIHNIGNCIYDFSLLDNVDEINDLMKQIISIDYHNQTRMKLLTGQVMTNILYVVEEAQIVLSSASLRRRENQIWLRCISTGRNIGQSFLFIGQRLSDISTMAIERCSGFLFGKMLGANDLRKLRSITDKKLSWLVRSLAVGEFYYYSDGQSSFVKFPLYQSSGRPIEHKFKQSWFQRWIYDKELANNDHEKRITV